VTAACLAHAGMLALVLFGVLAPSVSRANRVALAIVAVGFGAAASLAWCGVEGWVP